MLLKNGLKFMINQKKITTLTKKLELKHQCLDEIYVILVMHTLLLNINVDKKTFTAVDFEDPNNTAANVTSTNNANNDAFGEKKLIFKNNAPLINCITKINGIKIDVEDLDVVMPMDLNTVKIIKKQQEAFGIIIEMNQIVVQIMIT